MVSQFALPRSTEKTGRLPQSTASRVKDAMARAQVQSQRADRAYTGGTGPTVDDSLSYSGLGKSLATGARGTTEETFGMPGDLQNWLGMVPSARLPQLPTSQQISDFTDWIAPEWLQKLTRYQPQGPVEESYKTLAEWGFDPTNLLAGPMGKIGKLGRFL
jgi:hypothetical protein